MTKNRNDADVAFIEALAELLQRNDLAEIDVRRDYGENDSLKVRVSRHTAAPVVQVPSVSHPVPAAETSATARPASRAPADAEDPAQHPGAVTSPMVGTVYLAAEPGASPFVTVGTQVSEGQTLMIIEAMKTMNHIPSPRAGTVKRILVADSTPVEYGAPLMIIE
jgi:acetyl-CoA carboxylase biotin carboxyl carrier protein